MMTTVDRAIDALKAYALSVSWALKNVLVTRVSAVMMAQCAIKAYA
jgi:hypothetical protein